MGTNSIRWRSRKINPPTQRDRDATRRRSAPHAPTERDSRTHYSDAAASSSLPWHFLYFLPEPHGHGSLRPTLGRSRLTGAVVGPSPDVRALPRACAAFAATSASTSSSFLSATPRSTIWRSFSFWSSGTAASSFLIWTWKIFFVTCSWMLSIISVNSEKPAFLYSFFGSFWP